LQRKRRGAALLSLSSAAGDNCQILKKLKKLNGNRIKKMETEERSEN
jgi:hypothetical protein